MANVRDISNIENILPGIGKAMPHKRFGPQNRQPLALATGKNGFSSESNTITMGAKAVKDEQLKLKDTSNYLEQDSFPAKKSTKEKQFSSIVGVTTRSQYNAMKEQHTSLGCPVPRDPLAFTIYEDEGEGDVIVACKKEEKTMAWMELKPSCLKDIDMEEEEEEEDDDIEDEEDFDEEYDEEAESSSIVDMSVAYDEERVSHPRISERNMDIERDLYGMSEYRSDIYVNCREAELRTMPRCDYMAKQPEVTYGMRSILVDWLFEVSEEYKIKRQTIFLAVNYIDRYLSRMACSREKLQLLGTAALFIASKYEEIFPPPTQEFINITDDSYTLKELLKMEHSLFKTLHFGVIVSTACFFGNDLIHQIRCSDMCISLTMYILEQTLVIGEEFLKYLPSLVATTSVFMSSIIVDKQNCIDRITEFTSYRLGDLRECFDSIVKVLNLVRSHPQQSVRNKYNQLKFHSVSQIALPDGLTIDQLLTF